MKIYFAGAIRGGRDDARLYQQIIDELKLYGEVLTEHVGDPGLSVAGEDGPNNQYIHDRDMRWLLGADVMVAEVTTPSLGVGYEIGRAVENQLPVLCLFREQEGKHLSAMIKGNIGITHKKYQTIDHVRHILDTYFKKTL